MWKRLYSMYREPGSFLNCMGTTWLAALCVTSGMWAFCVPLALGWIFGVVSIGSGTLCVQAFIEIGRG